MLRLPREDRMVKRASLPDAKEFSLSRLSFRRKANQANLLMLVILLVAILVCIASFCSFHGVQDALHDDLDVLRHAEGTVVVTDDTVARTEQAISIGRTLLLVVGVISVLVALLTMLRLITIGLRSVALEVWIRRMGAGDLDYRVEMEGKDEISELAAALEKLRQSSIRAQQLNLVEELSKGLQEKNEELERVLEELRQAQDQVILRQKLAELGELTAGIAHEIRNPLNFVKNFTQASEELLVELGEELDESLDELGDEKRKIIAEISQELTDNLERIRSHGDRANRIIRNMLMIGRGGGEMEVVNLHDLLKEHTMLAFHSVRANDLSFQLDIRNDFDPNVGGVSLVSEDMGRVIINMVTNACYATDEKRRSIEGGSESFMPTIWLKTERKTNSVDIRIRDNGTGIPPEAMEKVFNPFFTTKPTDKGTGLGLSLSNDIVRRHGGSITVASEPGEYTEMRISLPASHAVPLDAYDE